MNESIPDPEKNNAGCLNPLIAFIAAVWIAGISYAKVAIEYVATSSVMAVPNHYWGLVAVGQIILLALPLLLLSWFWKNAVYRAIFQSWLLAIGFLLITLPAYFLPQAAANGRALYQIAAALLLSIVIRFVNLRGSAQSTTTASPSHTIALPAALFVAGIFMLPWIVWGAAGSLLEMLLQLLSALSLGVLAVLLNAVSLKPFASPDGAGGSAGMSFSHFRAGFAASITLLLLASGTTFSFGAMQFLLMISLPALGWVMLGAGRRKSRDEEPQKVAISLAALAPAALLVGLCAAAPMMWFDPDELALIISASMGESMIWAGYASAVSLALGLLAAITARLWVGFWGEFSGEAPRPAAWLLPAAAWIGVAILFVAEVRGGFHGEGLFVILTDQADLGAVQSIADPLQRRSAVYQSLLAHAGGSQSSLRARLDRWGIAYQPYFLVNAIQVRGGPLLRLWLEQQPEVDRVLDNPWMRPLPRPVPVSSGEASAPDQVPWNITQIQADRVWEDFGARGQGIVIGNSDSGMQVDHPELQDSYRGLGGSNDYNWFDPWNHTRQPTDIGGHGTHTLGLVLGNSTGVAPDAQWIGCVNLARNLGSPALYLDCLQFMLAPFPLDGDPWRDGRPELGAQVLNISWGCPLLEGCDEQSLEPAVQSLRAAGVFVVASAGNDGPICGSLTSPPAVYDAAYSIGAVDSSGSLAFFSSIGLDPAATNQGVKPDLLAPGVEVLSAFPNSTYAVQSGTSMAGPHVAGVVALIWSANPDLIGDIQATEQILSSTARAYTGLLPACPGASADPSTAAGYGLVDAYQAVQLALQGK